VGSGYGEKTSGMLWESPGEPWEVRVLTKRDKSFSKRGSISLRYPKWATSEVRSALVKGPSIYHVPQFFF